MNVQIQIWPIINLGVGFSSSPVTRRSPHQPAKPGILSPSPRLQHVQKVSPVVKGTPLRP